MYSFEWTRERLAWVRNALLLVVTFLMLILIIWRLRWPEELLVFYILYQRA